MVVKKEFIIQNEKIDSENVSNSNNGPLSKKKKKVKLKKQLSPSKPHTSDSQ